MKYLINGVEFNSLKAIKQYVKKISQDNIGRCLPVDQFVFMLELLKRHTQATQKIGVGVISIFVGKAPPPWNNDCFYARRVDGSVTDFSYLECITPSTARSDFTVCCRNTAAEQIVDFKVNAFRHTNELPSAISGTLMTWDTCHVDHDVPIFSEIVNQFIELMHIDVSKIEFIRGDNLSMLSFVDKELECKWQTFHREKAVLRIITIEENLKRGSK